MNALHKTHCVAAVHQDQLLEAMGAGFLLPSRDDLREDLPVPAMLRVQLGTVLPLGFIAAAKANRRHGATCVLSLDVPVGALHELSSGGHGLTYPIPVPWITHAAPPDELALRELLARVASFPDIVESSIPIGLGSATGGIKPIQQVPPSPKDADGEELELGLGSLTPPKRAQGRVDTKAEGKRTGSTAPIVLGPIPGMDADGKALLHAVDKVGGTIVGLLWGTMWSIIPEQAPAGKVALFARATVDADNGPALPVDRMAGLLLGGAKYASDRAVISAAARRLANMDAADGIDPMTFLGQCVEACLREPGVSGELKQEFEDFKAGTNAVLSSQMELRPEGVADASHIGSRALLVFLLNPTHAGLERFLERRPGTGKKVALLAKMLVGLYSGLAAMPKELKGRPPALLGRIAELALAIERGEHSDLTVSSSFNGKGQQQTVVMIGDAVLYEALDEVNPRVEKLVLLLSGMGVTVGHDSVTGALEAHGGAVGGNRPVLVSFTESSSRLPIRSCIEFCCRIDRTPKPLSTKDGMLAALHQAASGPVAVRRRADGVPGVFCSIQIEEEAANEVLVREALNLLLARVMEFVPAPKAKPRRVTKAPGVAPGKKKPQHPGASAD